MVLILDGRSEHVVHLSGNMVLLEGVKTYLKTINVNRSNYLSTPTYASCSELPSIIKTMIYILGLNQARQYFPDQNSITRLLDNPA